MRFRDSSNDCDYYDGKYGRECCSPCYEHKRCCKEICINNNPVIKINVNGGEKWPSEPKPFLSCYIEALGTGQTVQPECNIVFDKNSVDSVGECIELDETGEVFTINKTGLYLVEWSVNLVYNTTSAVVGVIENGTPASGSATVTGGNFSSGTLINVDTVPFTLSLHNFNGEFTLGDVNPYENSAASIRIARFADGPVK